MSANVIAGNRSTAEASATAAAARATLLREGPILSTLVRLSLPNLVALCSATVVSIAETAYVGSLGVAALGGIALVFPIFMLMQMLSAGAMGGTVSGAISRALGGGDYDGAQALALCSLAIGLVLGLALTVAVLTVGPLAYSQLGGSGEVLQQAIIYSNVAALGIVAIWVTNMLASIARGSGNMAIPATTQLAAGVVQIVVGGAFGLGIGPLPRLGMAGVALGQLVAFSCAAVTLFLYLRSTRARLQLRLDPSLLSITRFAQILRFGAVAMLSPLLSVTTVLVLTAMVARYGPEALAGYGIGVRLEFLLIPIAFSVGVACVPMVGTAIGGGDVPRARRIAWTAGALAASALGVLGVLVVSFPELWVDMFTNNPAVRHAAYSYLSIAGFSYAFFGLGLCLYFASQGAGRVGGAIAAQALRLAVVLIGGLALLEMNAPMWSVFLLSAVAMIPMGLGTALFIKLARW
ncbi:MATE family efflux transporter [Sphingorhabdus pulchriflava]|uniref:MATE family efflux transporter n=1 Tax=Sphingorhabdus pulchriflava TaxID=2292257 RepID=A0A371B1G9_9SPHN|nr:MATE family efflux transporter [Sphingorhabdus pulchriflava]RDV01436.1 MATE family efflux transporter [Sphingorhabdus pulchriflava]